MNESTNQSKQLSTEVNWSREQVDLVKNTVCRGATNDELQLFMYVCKKTGLDPFTKQIHSVARWDSKLGCEVRTTQTSIDGFRVIAERSGKYCGQLGPFWCGEDGRWTEVWLKEENPMAAKVGVLKEGFREPLWSVALWSNYCPMIRDKQTGKMNPSKFWKSMGPLMLGKVAECLSLRRAFPQDIGHIFLNEEMQQADADMENEPQRPDSPPPQEESSAKKEAEKKEIAIKELEGICAKATKGMPIKDKASWMKRVLKVNSFDEIKKMSSDQISTKGADVIRDMNRLNNEEQK